MAALEFASSHNTVAFLDKPTESDRFEQIVDFLNAHPIKYALTVNPTIYTACIEQFWATTKVKTINGEVQIQDLVDKKNVIITKTSVRSDLQLEDAEGTECLLNATIFEQLTLMGAKTTAWNEFSSTMASDVTCLATNQKFNFSKYIFDNMMKNLEGRVKFLMYPRKKQRKYTEDPQLSGPTEPVTDDTENVASVPTHSNDPLLSGEDSLKLNELIELCTSLSQRVLDLEKIKTSQAAEITELKKRVKRLEKKGGSRTHRLERLYKVGRSVRVVSSEDQEVTLVDETQGRYDDNLMFDTGVLDNEQDMAEKEVDMAEKDISTADPVTTAGEVVTTANVLVSTAKVTTDSTMTKTVDELTLAQTLIKIKAAKPKARGIITQEPNYELASRLQAKEQGELTIEEKSRLFMELMNKRKKHFARLRAEEQRRKPPTMAQKRNRINEKSKHICRHGYRKLDENVEAEVDDDQEEAEMKKHTEIVLDNEVAIDAIPLATKTPIIID
ncbi:hypothetical protein Tco_0763863 [Tanacetum coccineum]